jgi:aspartyl-tRNA(Asn)/glutamyl-tRNA(Gln) amidotransferase subunit A
MHNKTVSELKKAIEKKEVSSLELTSHFLDRIKNKDPELNSFITLTEEHAIDKAKMIDKRISKGILRPLSGIPLRKKISFVLKILKQHVDLKC